jgi:hypothetical protein
VDHSSGANCFVALDATQRGPRRGAGASGPPPTKHRFLEGGVDEVCFLGPELGSLRALLVGPEAGRWYCDEIDVYSSRSGHTDRRVLAWFGGWGWGVSRGCSSKAVASRQQEATWVGGGLIGLA